mmetsp:Transcript_29054/g.52927  ORF Transcript_29054/g.52927 Transcript_29054/m.52927 type:complete len:780 (+) Transcript_29054:64-2403(+)
MDNGLGYESAPNSAGFDDTSDETQASEGADFRWCDTSGQGLTRGMHGATSIKEEIAEQMPELNDASSFRKARRLLQELGGASVLLDELTIAGWVDPDTCTLTVSRRPCNLFARLASGQIKQRRMEHEQHLLGSHKEKFLVCANKSDADEYWDSLAKKRVGRASMSKRHRLLTTRDLAWTWFNALAFGLSAEEELGAADRKKLIQNAITEVEAMKDAAMRYASNAGGWSSQVGLFFNIFGHNNVNSLHLHILDMSELGPSFDVHRHKNCPLDDVLKVLREELAAESTPALVRASSSMASQCPHAKISQRPRRQSFSGGADGATSLKGELVARVPVLKDAAGFREARRLVMEELGGPHAVYEELCRCGFVDCDTKKLAIGKTAPFNVFARIAAGELVQPGLEAEQSCLGEFKDRFMIARNRPENDEHWDSNSAEWVGTSSMSRYHRFLIRRDNAWHRFNALVFGMAPPELGGLATEAAEMEDALNEVEMMKKAAMAYTSSCGGWSENVGLYFHVFGHNSVNSMHLHILDMNELGPSYWHHQYHNCSIDAVLKVLREELAALTGDLEPFPDHDVEAPVQGPYGNAPTHSALRKSLVPPDGARQVTGFNHIAEGKLKEDTDLLELNVGGELVVVPRSTLLLAPAGSRLSVFFQADAKEEREALSYDSEGRIFLNFPARSFKVIVDRLRLLHNTPADEVLLPMTANLHGDFKQELEHLAWILGLGPFLTQPQHGRSPSSRTVGPRTRLETTTSMAPSLSHDVAGGPDGWYFPCLNSKWSQTDEL